MYSLVEDRLVPHEQAWASIPNASLLRSTEVLMSLPKLKSSTKMALR